MLLPHERAIAEYEETIEKFRQQNKGNPLFLAEIDKLEKKLSLLKQKVYSRLTPWERVTIARHPKRPHTIDYIRSMCDSFTELCGDRAYGDDQALIGGLARIGEEKFILIGQEKGNDTDSRVKHNFGMLSPHGFRKALRLMRLAEKFDLPVVSLIDTSGAYPGLKAEELGQGHAIAYNLREMAQVATPILVIVIGEGCSGGALGIGVGDRIGMLEHAYYTVISPEGCASILWKDAGKNKIAIEALKVNAENLLELGIIDTVIPEPAGGAHHDPEQTFKAVRNFILTSWDALRHMPPRLLLENRYQKFRQMGRFTDQVIKTQEEEEGPQPETEESLNAL